MEQTTSVKKTYKTQEPNFWQKLMQVYWFNPKSWLLDEFSIDNEILSFKTKAGKTITAPITDLRIRVQVDNYDRHEVYVTHGKEKLHFKEIGYMLSDEEWEEIFDILSLVPDTGITAMGWITAVARKVINELES